VSNVARLRTRNPKAETMSQTAEALSRIATSEILERITIEERSAYGITALSALGAIRSEIAITEPTTLDRAVMVAVRGIGVLDAEETEEGANNAALIRMLADEALADVRAAAVAEFIR
jgi:hypothetical protein